MKIYSKNHEKALKLKRDMDEISKTHLKHIKDFERIEKTEAYRKNKLAKDKMFEKREKRFNEKEDIAYKKYYEHMHKDFTKKEIEKNMVNKKYKDHFVDKKFINDMYKTKEVKNAKKK